MKKIGITGQSGFIGTHLYNTLSLHPDEFRMVPYQRNYFENPRKLDSFVSECDCIVHLAAMNRHGDPFVIYETNIMLVEELIASLERTQSTPRLLFSSSTQEERDNPYGKSKKEGRQKLSAWAGSSNAEFTPFIIPNVYGPFGDPYYNSVVATFSHQLTHDEQPEIIKDAELQLIYVNELVARLVESIRSGGGHPGGKEISPTAHCSVTDLLARLKNYKTHYFDNGIIPELDSAFDVNLFNTFQSYIDYQQFFPFECTKHADERGEFVETMRLNVGGQVSYSTTNPGVTRGNHFHTRKIERFTVIKGEALIKMRKIGSDEVLEFQIPAGSAASVDMPIWYTHNICNTGEEELITLFWVNEFYDPDDTDTYYENV